MPASAAAPGGRPRPASHREQVIDVPRIALGRHDEPGRAGERGPIAPAPASGAARSSPASQRQPRAKDGRLHLVEPRVHAELAVMIAIGLAAVPEPLRVRGDRARRWSSARRRRRARRDSSSGRSCTRRRRRSCPTGRPSHVARCAWQQSSTMARLCRAATAAMRGHVGGLPVEVHGHDGRGARRDGGGRGRRGSSVSRSGSMSANTGRAPTIMIASAV